MIPISTLVKTEEKIHEVFPETKVYVTSGPQCDIIIGTEIDGHGGVYRLRYSFNTLEIDNIKDKDSIFEYIAYKIINSLKEKGFKSKES